MTDLQNVRTLIADDEIHVRLFIKTLLTGMGAQVVGEAGDGNKAVELFETTKPDLVLLDINMPILDGTGALRKLRELSSTVVIIMLTSLASSDVVQTCLDAGADYLLRKDLPLDELRQEIAETWQDYAGDGSVP